jgi:hypothetical protein
MTIKKIEFPETKTESVSTAVHRIFCLDCSGSMSSSMDEMRKQLKNKLPTLIRDTDFVTIIWFSGRGQCGTIFEHISIKDLTDLQTIHSTIDRYLHTIGSTGFVEPIRKAKELAEKYEEQPQVFFLSDGGENSWPLDETRRAFSEMRGIPMVIVEYQYYCDRAFLQELAQLSDGVSIFNEDFEMYNHTFSCYMQNRISRGKVIELDDELNHIIYFDEETFVIKTGKNGKIQVPEHVSDVYEISEQEENEKTYETNELYLLMLYAIQKRSHPLMMKALSNLGDVYLIRRYSSCFSKQDYSRLFDYIKNCYFRPDEWAFKEGIDYTFKPKDDAFNVIEFLSLIQNDKRSRFYPYHSSFKYERISKETDEKDETCFIPNREIGSTFSLVFNQSRANISLGCQVYGHNYKESEESIVPVTAYRNYAILKDGIKNVNVLPMKISNEIYDKLVEEKCIKVETDEVYDKNKIYEITISNLPVVNRKFATNAFTSSSFCEKHIQVHISKGNVKYLKKMLEFVEKEEEKSEDTNKIDYERKKVDPNAVRDFYQATELVVKIAKCSAIPTINEKLLTKMDSSPEKLTRSEELLYGIHCLYKSVPQEERKKWINDQLLIEREKITSIGMELEQCKMAILIGGCWFSDVAVDETTFLIDYSYDSYDSYDSYENKRVPFEVSVEISDTKVYMD